MDSLLDNLNNDKIRLSYFGSFSDDITDKLIGISEFCLEHKSELGTLKNKVSFLIAECFQNIVRHGDEKGRTRSFSHSDFFQFNVTSDRVVLASCNLIKNTHIESLEKKLIQVNSLNVDELKKFYNEVLEKDFSDKGGAGLGLIQMARKSSLPIKYLFKETENKMSQFFLCLEVPTKKGGIDRIIKINEIEQFYQSLFAKNILMLYKGDFSKDTINPLLAMLQYNFNTHETLLGKEKRSIITLIEALQNIAKHGKIINGIREGIFIITTVDDNYILEVGNYVEKSNYKILEETLTSIKRMDLDEVAKLYKKRLMEPEIKQDGNCGLGLLEIARNSGKNFSYNFTSTPQNEFFYTIKITI